MKAVLQRVKNASVSVKGTTVAKINQGLVVLLGVAKDDNKRDADAIVGKIQHLRIFPDENGKMNRSIKERDGTLLVVSQFTLLADLNSGRRPSFSDAALPAAAEELYHYVVNLFKTNNCKVEEGCFGEYMELSLVNDGPITLVIDTKNV